ncbi:hypothetical protein FDA94_28830 [Herbidospora galbida]|uniref:Uncharacterized protein n=1 Tax=Herbidospora galbida TaxID=2575442 RepID=A0A4U3MAD8_9ACTN|nr:hypothetical protein [Herbidospora galbida]TKK84637.1 hypothetical protein FDA94_28830 [Herbidospora galbida]
MHHNHASFPRDDKEPLIMRTTDKVCEVLTWYKLVEDYVETMNDIYDGVRDEHDVPRWTYMALFPGPDVLPILCTFEGREPVGDHPVGTRDFYLMGLVGGQHKEMADPNGKPIMFSYIPADV